PERQRIGLGLDHLMRIDQALRESIQFWARRLQDVRRRPGSRAYADRPLKVQAQMCGLLPAPGTADLANNRPAGGQRQSGLVEQQPEYQPPVVADRRAPVP